MFKCHRKDNTSKAWRYLCGLIQGNRPMGENKRKVYDAEYYQLQHFITDSPWDSRPVMDKIAQEADRLIGSDSMSCLVLTLNMFDKKGFASVGLWLAQNLSTNRYSKLSFPELIKLLKNPRRLFAPSRAKFHHEPGLHKCQMAIFGALCCNEQSALIDAQLHLPEYWIFSDKCCARAGIQGSARKYYNYAELVCRIVERQRQAGLRFDCVYVQKIIGDKLDLCRRLYDSGEKFMVRVPCELMVFQENPQLGVKPAVRRGQIPPPQNTISLYRFADLIPMEKWERVTVRKTATAKQYDVCLRQVWVQDSDEKKPRRYLLYMRREHRINSEYFLSNLPEDTTLAQLAHIESNQFLATLAGDKCAEVGIADYQVRSLRGWYHHITMAMLAALFKLKQQIITGSSESELSEQDIKAMLDDFLLKQNMPEQRTMEPVEVPSQSLLGTGKDSGTLKTSSPDRNRVA